MRVTRVTIDFKGVQLDLEWAPLIVLFGRNDAGKTNTIEALSQLSEPWNTDLHVRNDPIRSHDEGFAIEQADLALEWRDVPGRPDREALRDLLLKGWTWFVPDPYRPGASHPPHMVALTDDVHAALADMVSQGADLAEAIEALDNEVRTLLGDTSQSGAVQEQLEVLLRGCLRSRWLRYDRGSIFWLAPSADELDETERVAARALADQQTLPLNLDQVARAVASEVKERVPFLHLSGDGDLVITPFRVVRLLATSVGIRELEREVESRIKALLFREHDLPAPLVAVADTVGLPDPWFSEDDAGAEALNPRVREIAERLSVEATRRAPLFVSESYEIVVNPLRLSRWWLTDGRRIRLELQPRRGGELVHLSIAGNGVALWAGYAVAEALAAFERENENAPPRKLLYLIDEPERHLHPTAQVEAAEFVARLARDGNEVVVATHSPAFIDAHFDAAALVCVHRGTNGITRGKEMTGDLLDQLRVDLEMAGLTLPDLLQLARGVLLVEGRHDKKIVESLCQRRLAEARIIVMPLRGAHETLALLDADLLRNLGKPLAVMLDNTRSEFVAQLRSGKVRLDRHSSTEERQLKNLAELLKRSDRELVREIAFDAPDVICALPEGAVRMLHPDFKGWKRATRVSAGGSAFKHHVEKEIGATVDTAWIDRVLLMAQEQMLPCEPLLERACNEAIAFVSTASKRLE